MTTRHRFRARQLALAVAAMGTLAASPAQAENHAKNIIFFLGDGMGPVTTTAARIHRHKEEGSLTMDTLPYAARIKTYSLDAQTTDSAPSMAAYMTGVKQRNEVVSMDGQTYAQAFRPATDVATKVANSVDRCPSTGNGQAVPTLMELAVRQYKATGVVTTARLTHATPAATYAHICHRDAEYAIARQAVPGGEGANGAIGAGLDVMLGGISQYWRPYDASARPRGRPDGRDLVAELQARGYQHVSDRAGLMAAGTYAGARLIGLFDQAASQGHMSYEADRDPSLEPSLSEMAVKAVDILASKPDGFFLMVEGGRIDHALHGTNAYRALTDTIAFDEALKAVIDRVKQFDPELRETLIVVTADHDHTIAFNGYGRRGTDVLGLSINYATGQPNLDANGVPYSTIVFGNGANRPAVRSNPLTDGTHPLGSKDYLQEVAIRTGGPGSETHGGGDVKLHAIGANAALFKGTMENTKVFNLIRQASGL